MMNHRKEIISNSIVWEVLSVEEVKYQLTKRGIIHDWFSGIRNEDWLINYTDYHVTVKNKNETFNRVFVLTEQEAKNILW